MFVSTITRKGQVTIPKKIRDSLKLSAGDKIEFLLTPNGEILMKPITRKVDEVYRILHSDAKEPVSVEQMDWVIKNKLKEKQK